MLLILPVVTLLASGLHTVTAQNAAGCQASDDITVAAAPGCTRCSLTQTVDPTCAVATGTITITSATAGLTFSLDGGHMLLILQVDILLLQDLILSLFKLMQVVSHCC